MNENRNEILKEKGLAFFGEITASVSHEINNAISIINEYSGLLEDLTYTAERGENVSSE